jgi:ribosomal protein L29
MIDVSQEEIDTRYDILIEAYKMLAEKENEFVALRNELAEFGESKSKKASKLRDQIADITPIVTELQQAYKVADMEVGRIMRHIDLMLATK